MRHDEIEIWKEENLRSWHKRRAIEQCEQRLRCRLIGAASSQIGARCLQSGDHFVPPCHSNARHSQIRVEFRHDVIFEITRPISFVVDYGVIYCLKEFLE